MRKLKLGLDINNGDHDRRKFNEHDAITADQQHEKDMLFKGSHRIALS
jgi:hypothetical protein